MKYIVLILLLAGCADYIPKYNHVTTMTIELMGCNGKVFEKHIIHDFQRNADAVQWECQHGLVVYCGNYRVTKI